MLSALNYLHRKNIVHRDLKPENWLFKSTAKDASLILIDFGTAKIVKEGEKYKDLVGTPFYLAPETASAQPYRTAMELRASDIWAVGVIAYICLTGSPPFWGRTNKAICRAICKNQVVLPKKLK
eukprot:UN34103